MSQAFGRTLLYGIVIGIFVGAVGGTALLPIVGTVLGAIVGLPVGLAMGALVATVFAVAAGPSVSAEAYRFTVDMMLTVVGMATAAFAAWLASGWTAEGIRSAVAVLVATAACLVIVRRPLRALGSQER